MSSISVVIVTRNRCEELFSLLAALEGRRTGEEEFIVVDNGSTDGTADRVRSEFPRVHLIGYERNRGAPAGRNAGAAAARGDLLVFLDDDAGVEDAGFFDRVRGAFAGQPAAGVVAFRILDPRTRLPRSFEIPCRRKDRADRPFETSYFIAAGCAVKREVYERVGGMDESLFYGFEELDFSYRAVSKGIRIFYRPEVWILHGLSRAGRPSRRRIFYFYRNKIWISVRYLPWRMIAVQFAVWSGYFLLESVRQLRPDVFLAALVRGWAGVVARRALRRRDRLDRDTLARLKGIEGRLFF